MKSIRIVALSAIFLYCTIYLILTGYGGYEDNVNTMAKVAQPCLCISDLELWQPKCLCYTRYEGRVYANNLGYFFAPLIWLDQRYWHKTKVLSLE